MYIHTYIHENAHRCQNMSKTHECYMQLSVTMASQRISSHANNVWMNSKPDCHRSKLHRFDCHRKKQSTNSCLSLSQTPGAHVQLTGS